MSEWIKRPIVCCSGGLDPIHAGHVAYITHAATFGDVVFILNSDAWLMRKKGYVFQKYEERAAIVGAIKGVVGVVPVDDADGSVIKALIKIRPDFYAKGGDRTIDNIPERETCEHIGIKMLFDVGGGKTQSSSKLVAESWGNIVGYLG